jgi:2-polyprenyl-3-methyl-5-hydroxy-6-metoxy-1,4-benzoquinol methylase
MSLIKSDKNDQKKEWDSIWGSKNIINRFVDLGRKLYNGLFLKIIVPHLKDNFCELGCGTSSLLFQIADYGVNCVGIDYSEQAIKSSEQYKNKHNYHNVKFVRDDCRDLKIKERFDVVWSQGLLEHFEEPAAIIKQHMKIAKKNGVVIISMPYRYSFFSVWYLLTRPKILRKLWPWTDQNLYSKRDLNKIVKENIPNSTKYKIFLLRPFVLGIAVIKIFI